MLLWGGDKSRMQFVPRPFSALQTESELLKSILASAATLRTGVMFPSFLVLPFKFFIVRVSKNERQSPLLRRLWFPIHLDHCP